MKEKKPYEHIRTKEKKTGLKFTINLFKFCIARYNIQNDHTLKINTIINCEDTKYYYCINLLK